MTVRREWVWAVDLAMSRLAFAFADLASQDVEVETLHIDSEFRDGQRLGLIDRQVRIYAQQVAPTYPPVVVFVEQPSGRFPKPQLSYAAGVVQAALHETLGCSVLTITSGEWKKQTVGVGNATKAQVGKWVRDRNPDVFSQDEADAYCIAYAGRMRVSIEGRAAA